MGILLISTPYSIQMIPPGIKIKYVTGAISPALFLLKIFHACGNPDNAITPPDIVANSSKIVIVLVVSYVPLYLYKSFPSSIHEKDSKLNFLIIILASYILPSS